MKLDSLSDLVVFEVPVGGPPRLQGCVRRLERALAEGRVEQAWAELHGALESLLVTFTGAAAGLVRRLESSRPELAALATHLDSLVHYERLLRFSLSVLRSLDHPAQLSLMRVFYAVSGRTLTPHAHSRWLQISGSPEPGLVSLSALVQEPPPQGPGAKTHLLLYLSLLNSWLESSQAFFREHEAVVRGSGGEARLIAFERAGFAFELLPAVAYGSPGEVELPLAPPPPAERSETRVNGHANAGPGEEGRRLETDFNIPEFDFVAPDPFEKENLDLIPGESAEVRPLNLRTAAPPVTNLGNRARDLSALSVPGISGSLEERLGSQPVSRSSGEDLLSRATPPLVEFQDWYRETPGLAPPGPSPLSNLSPQLIPSETPGEGLGADLLEWYSDPPSAPPASLENLRVVRPPKSMAGPTPAEPPPTPPRPVVEAPKPAPEPRPKRTIRLPTRSFVTGVRARDRNNGLGGFGRGAFKLWSPEQLESVRNQVDRTFPPLTPALLPEFLLEEVRHFVSTQASGYLLLEGPQGTGKTLAASSLASALGQALPVVTFPVRANLQGDFQTFIEVLDEHLRIDSGALRAGFRPLGHRVTRELNVRYPGTQCAERFTAYLSELSLLNGTRYLLVLDGLDEVFEGTESNVLLSDFLAEVPPEGVYIVLTYREDGCPSRTLRKLNRVRESGAQPLTIDPARVEYRRLVSAHLQQLTGMTGPGLDRVLEVARGRLAFARHLAEAVRSGLFSPTDLPGPEDCYDRLLEGLERRSGERLLKLFLLAATSYDPVAVEDLSALGIDSSVVVDILQALPSLFRYSREPNRVGLQLAHEAFRQHLQENYAGRYSQACERLAGRAARELLASCATDKPDQPPIPIPFEGLRSRFDRLYRWLLDSQNSDLMYRVVSSAELTRLRQEVCNRLEHQGRFHHKLSILDGLKECLAVLVSKLGRSDLREELAWAHNSRGLTYLKLGQFSRCLEEIERAVIHFQALVEQDGNDHLRNGLAAAHNRRSEALRYLGRFKSAQDSADLAVEQYNRVVDELGREELRHLYALALTNRGTTLRLQGEVEPARADLDQALEIYRELVQQKAQLSQRRPWSEALHSSGRLHLDTNRPAEALANLNSALELLHQCSLDTGEEDLRNDLATVHSDRAAAHYRLGDRVSALTDYGRAISIRSELVGEGRLDLRSELANTLTQRGLIQSETGDMTGGLEDHTRSLAFRSRLIEVEGHHELRIQRAFSYLSRGACLRCLGRPREALQDYEKAVEDYLYGLNLGQLSSGEVRELAGSYISAGLLHLELGEAEQAADRCTSAISLISTHLGPSGRDMALAYNHRGQAQRSLGDRELARDDFTQAISLYNRLVQEDGRAELICELGQSHASRAAVAFELQDADQALKDSSRAIALYTGLLSVEAPPEVTARLGRSFELRALSHLSLQSFEAALDDANRAVDRFQGLFDGGGGHREELAQVRVSRGMIRAAMGDHEVALEDYRVAIELLEQMRVEQGPQWAGPVSRALLVRCRSHMLLLDSTRAAQDLLFAYRLDPREFGPDQELLLTHLVMTLKQEAGSLLRSGTMEGAIRVYDQLVELAGSLLELDERSSLGLRTELLEALNYRGWAQTSLGRYGEALDDFARSIQVCQEMVDSGRRDQLGSLAWAYNHRGVTLDWAGRLEEAESDYGQAISLYTACVQDSRLELRAALATAWSNRALLCLRGERFQQAVTDLSAAIELRRSLAREDKRTEQLELLASNLSDRAQASEVLDASRDAIRDYQEAIGYYFRLVDEFKRADLESELVRCSMQLCRLEMDARELSAPATLTRTASSLTRFAAEGLEVASEVPVTLLEYALELEQAPSDLIGSLILMMEALLHVKAPESGWGNAPDLLLRLANRLEGQGVQPNQLLVVASRYCLLELERFGSPALPRVLRCLFLLGQGLQASPPPPNLHLAATVFESLVRHLPEFPATDGFNLEANNTAKLWQAVGRTALDEAGIQRSLLNQIRRW